LYRTYKQEEAEMASQDLSQLKILQTSGETSESDAHLGIGSSMELNHLTVSVDTESDDEFSGDLRTPLRWGDRTRWQ
jgi:hypothetical protein